MCPRLARVLVIARKLRLKGAVRWHAATHVIKLALDAEKREKTYPKYSKRLKRGLPLPLVKFHSTTRPASHS